MKRSKFFWAGTAAVLAAAFIFLGCSLEENAEDKASELTLGQWTRGSFTAQQTGKDKDGNTTYPNPKENWYKFTADSTAMYYLHFSFLQLREAKYQAQSLDGKAIGKLYSIEGNTGQTGCYKLDEVVSGETYYFKIVQPSYDTGGTYKIAISSNKDQAPEDPDK